MPRGPSRPLRSAGEMDEGTATTARELQRGRVDAALRRRANWEQLIKFCVVGATGYAVNLVVYTLLLKQAGLHYTAAAIGSFLVAVTNNYAWNRLWTFRGQRGHVVFQGLRFLVVSTMALVANLVVLHLLVQAGLGEIVAQALAIMLCAGSRKSVPRRLTTATGVPSRASTTVSPRPGDPLWKFAGRTIVDDEDR